MLKTAFFVVKPSNVTYRQAVPHLLSFFQQTGSGKIVCTKKLLRRYVPLGEDSVWRLGAHDVHVVSPGNMGKFTDLVTCVISPGPWTEARIGPEAFVAEGEQFLLVFGSQLWRLSHVPIYEDRLPYTKRLKDANVECLLVEWDRFAELYPAKY